MVNLSRKMTRGSFLAQFKYDTPFLISAVEGKSDLEEDQPKLYNQLYNYYKDKEVYFYNDRDKDYNIILEELEYDLMDAGVIR
tara:strand:- start:441 stop:689 length:249 start_codon:yes stop_codon:yes gene_type:complete